MAARLVRYHPAVFKRALGLFDTTMLVIGGIIGTGIFVNPYLVARALPSTPLVLAAWVVGGMVALAGAFAYAELAQQLPKVGGPYAYLAEAWHPLAGFLYGWALLLMIEAGAMAAVALNFARYAMQLAGRTDVALVPIGAAAIVVLTVVNYVGVKPGSRVLNVLVLLKLGAIGLLIGFAWWAPASPEWWHQSRPAESSVVLAFGAALIPIMFTYGGWQTSTCVAPEMRNPERDLPRGLVIGTVVVIVVYLLANLAYLRTLGLAGLAGTTAPAAGVAHLWLGAGGARFISATIAISTFGFLDLSILAAPRVYYAMAADGTFLPALARLHPRYQTPATAIVAQSAFALALLLISGRYESLVNTVTFADWIFFALTAAGLFVLRRRHPSRAGFRTPGYPWVPLFFVVVAVAVVLSSIRAEPANSAVGAALLALGVPIYFWFSGQSRRARGAAPPQVSPH
jgi:APA family basic amino acid/polyamine antiporter